jgi:transposase
MNRKSNDLRKLYKKLKSSGIQQKEVCIIIGISNVTASSWNKLDDFKLFTVPDKSTRKPSIDLEELKIVNKANPTATNEELGLILNCSKKVVQTWRKRIGLRRKVTSKTYLEADDELKKTLQTKSLK